MNTTLLFPQQQLSNFRKVGDELADKTVKALFDQNYNPLQNKDYAAYQFNGQQIPDSFPDELKAYLEVIKTIPIDDKLIKKGSDFFVKYAQSIMLCLGLYSLPYCYAAANGAKVLASSKRIMSQPGKRLTETADFVLDLHDPEAFNSKGKALVSIAKVRLMHAAIRYHLLENGQWNLDWGYPINQMDMAGTNYSFSLIMVRGLRKLGFDISADSAQSYLQFWNEIGKLLGLKEELMPETNEEAYVLEQKIRKDQFRYSKEGEQLTQALLGFVDAQENPFPIKGSAIAAFLLGDELTEMLSIKDNTDQEVIMAPFKLFNRLQQTLLSSNKSYRSIVAEFKKAQQNSGDSENFNFLMSLADE